MDKNHTNDHRKRHTEDRQSVIINRIITEIETETGKSIDRLKRSFKDLALYKECLRCTTATNAAICTAIDLPVDVGEAYRKSLAADKLIWNVQLIDCPFAIHMQWTLTTSWLKVSKGNPHPVKIPKPSPQ